MPTITLSSLVHKNASQIAIHFDYNEDLKRYIKAFGGVKWSKTHNVFYIEHTSENKRNLFDYLRKQNHYINYSALHSSPQTPVQPVSKSKPSPLGKLNKFHYDALKSFETYLLQKRYSHNTIENYVGVLRIFFRFYPQKAIQEITKDDIILFNQDYILNNGYSRTFQNQVISAIKLFYNHHSNLQMDVSSIERPIKDKRLPEILSQDEVKKLLTNVKNVKHKTILSLVYACGLRIGEALALKMDAIDSKRGFIHIKHAKGAKDRFVPLSEKTLALLRHYYTLYKPKVYLFEGNEGQAYSQESCRKILRTAVEATSIKKHVTLHTLRHSYATHLLESGTDLRYIQDILGHNSPKTTMIYTHVSQSSLKNIKNPFDEMGI
jgi:site-specific recombinase XerD